MNDEKKMEQYSKECQAINNIQLAAEDIEDASTWEVRTCAREMLTCAESDKHELYKEFIKSFRSYVDEVREKARQISDNVTVLKLNK